MTIKDTIGVGNLEIFNIGSNSTANFTTLILLNNNLSTSSAGFPSFISCYSFERVNLNEIVLKGNVLAGGNFFSDTNHSTWNVIDFTLTQNIILGNDPASYILNFVDGNNITLRNLLLEDNQFSSTLTQLGVIQARYFTILTIKGGSIQNFTTSSVFSMFNMLRFTKVVIDGLVV